MSKVKTVKTENVRWELLAEDDAFGGKLEVIASLEVASGEIDVTSDWTLNLDQAQRLHDALGDAIKHLEARQ